MSKQNELIESILEGIGLEKNASSSEVKQSIFKIASVALEASAQKIRDLNEKVASLENKIGDYERIEDEKKKSALIDNIVNTMFNREMLKKSDINSKKEELKKLNFNELKVLEDTVSKIPEKVASEEYVSDLTFIYDDNKIKSKKTLVDSINEFCK